MSGRKRNASPRLGCRKGTRNGHLLPVDIKTHRPDEICTHTEIQQSTEGGDPPSRAAREENSKGDKEVRAEEGSKLGEGDHAAPAQETAPRGQCEPPSQGLKPTGGHFLSNVLGL